MRSPSDFASQLAIHVNHLNKAVKESEITYALGFEEATHFNSVFKKYLRLTPTQFRKLIPDASAGDGGLAGSV